jgi:hypothetical protein
MIPENISLSGEDEISGRFKKKFKKKFKKLVKLGTKTGMAYATGGTSLVASSALKKDFISGDDDPIISGDMIGKSFKKKFKKVVKKAAKVATSTPAKYVAVAAAAAGTGFVAAKYGSTIKNAISKKVSSFMAPATASAEQVQDTAPEVSNQQVPTPVADPVVNIPTVQSFSPVRTQSTSTTAIDPLADSSSSESMPSETANNAALVRTVADDTTPTKQPAKSGSGGFGKIFAFGAVCAIGYVIWKAGSGKGVARK